MKQKTLKDFDLVSVPEFWDMDFGLVTKEEVGEPPRFIFEYNLLVGSGMMMMLMDDGSYAQTDRASDSPAFDLAFGRSVWQKIVEDFEKEARKEINQHD